MQPILLLLLGLAAAASAFPQKRSISKDEFTLSMRLGAGEDAPIVGLKAVRNGTSDSYFLVGDTGAKSHSRATHAYTNGTSPDEALNLDMGGVSYGLSVPDIGDLEGVAIPISPAKGYQDFGFSVGSEVNHQLTSGAQLWLACNMTINNHTVPVLSWGSEYENGSFVSGCYATSVYKNCTVPGSCATC